MSLSVLSGLSVEQRRLLYLSVILVAVGWVLYRVQPPCGYLVMELPLLPADPRCSPSGWDPVDVEQAFFGLGLDFLFIVLYSWWLSSVCFMVEERLADHHGLKRTIHACGSMVWVAGALDVVENIGLYYWLAGSRETPLAWMITATAGSKFLILCAVALCLLVTAGPALRGKRPA